MGRKPTFTPTRFRRGRSIDLRYCTHRKFKRPEKLLRVLCVTVLSTTKSPASSRDGLELADVPVQVAKRGAQTFLHDRVVERHLEHLRDGHLRLQRPCQQMADVLGIRPDHLRAEEASRGGIAAESQETLFAKHHSRPPLVPRVD